MTLAAPKPAVAAAGPRRPAAGLNSEPGSGLLVVEAGVFRGPLDLLLHLIRTQDIDIFDIPIAPITRQFLAAVRVLEQTGLNEAGEFLELAAALVRIKARMLLPAPPGEEDEDPRADLVRRLLEYEQVRDISRRLRTAEDDRGRRFAKGYVPARPRPRLADAPLDLSWDEFLDAAMRTGLASEPDPVHRMTTAPVAMSDKVKLILATLRGVRRVEFSSLVAPWQGRMHGVMTLLAGLELGRRQIVSLRQSKPFSPLWMYKGARMDSDIDEDLLAAEFDTADSVVGPAGAGSTRS